MDQGLSEWGFRGFPDSCCKQELRTDGFEWQGHAYVIVYVIGCFLFLNCGREQATGIEGV